MPVSYFTAAEQVGYSWVPLDLTGKSSFQAPEWSVIGGQENGKPTYVARVEHKPGHWEVAKLNNWCKFGYGWFGRELESSIGQVLVAPKDQEPAWMSSAFGEHVNGSLSIAADDDHLFIARTFYNNRWIPGKVVSRLGLMYFPYGGKELQRRHYQLLLGSLSWQKVESILPRWLVPIDPLLPSCLENSIQLADETLQEDKPTHQRLKAKDIRLVQRSLDECEWVVSGDGADVRNAVMVHSHQIGRKFIPHKNQWMCGWVMQSVGAKKGYLQIQHASFDTYEVLTANCNRMRTTSVQLSYNSEDKTGQLTSPNEVFLVTKVRPGESTDTAYHEMMDSFQASQVVKSLEDSQKQTSTCAADSERPSSTPSESQSADDSGQERREGSSERQQSASTEGMHRGQPSVLDPGAMLEELMSDASLELSRSVSRHLSNVFGPLRHL